MKTRVGINTRAVHKVRHGMTKAQFRRHVASQQTFAASWAGEPPGGREHEFNRAALARKVLERGKFSEAHPAIKRFGTQVLAARQGVYAHHGPVAVKPHVRKGRQVKGYSRRK